MGLSRKLVPRRPGINYGQVDIPLHLGSPVSSPTARIATISVAYADDIPTPPPVLLSRLKRNPYAGRRAYRRTSKVEPATAVPVSRAPTTHAASDSETLTSTLPVTSTDVPFAPRLSYLDVATNAVSTQQKGSTPLAKGPEQAGSTPNAPLSPEGKLAWKALRAPSSQ